MAYGDSAYWDAYAKRQGDIWQADRQRSEAVKTAWNKAFPNGLQGALRPPLLVGGGATAAGGFIGQTEPGPIELFPQAATGGSTAADQKAVEDTTTAGMDPMLAFLMAQSAAARALALDQARAKTDAGLASLGQNLNTGRADLADVYNRNSPMVATDFLRRGMATSGVANTGIARFHQDYVKSVNKLESEYQNARTQLLMELSAVESDTSQQMIMDMLNTLLKTSPTTG